MATNLIRRKHLSWLLVLLVGLTAGWGNPAQGQQSSTTTTLSASSTSVAANHLVTFTATVKTGGQPIAAGQVLLCNAAASHCEGPAILGRAQIVGNGKGTATFNLILSPGSHSIDAVFNGTAKAATSTSSAVTVTVGAGSGPTITALTATGNSGAYSLTANVSGLGSSALSGAVSFVDVTDGNLGLGSATLGTSSKSQSFVAAAAAATGSEPASIAVGDFNGDGIPDIAAANVNSNSISILLGNGNGTFTNTGNGPQTGSGPGAIVAGDFNDDGNLDLAVVDVNDNDVQFLFGNGAGGFNQGGAFAVGSGPVSLVAADFNQDGQLDIAVLNQDSSNVTIWLGGGTGSFMGVSQSPGTDEFPYWITSGDFNSDGIPDLAIANYFGFDVTILLGKGDGTFTPGATLNAGVYPTAVTIGDFNGDGKVDLAVTNAYSQDISIFLGDGKGDFSGAAQAPVTDKNPDSVTVGDFNGDGKQDLAVACSNSNVLDIYLGNGDGTFGVRTSVATGSAPYSATAVDLNGDGFEDIAVGDAGAATAQGVLNEVITTASAAISKVAAPGGGTDSVVATYAGNTNYGSSTSSAVSLTGTRIATTTAIAVGTTTLAVGEEVQITGTVQPSTVGNLTATGYVSLYDGSTYLGQTPVINGVVAFNANFTTTGQHSLTLFYGAGGDPNFLPSTSGAALVTVVNSSASTTTLTASASSVAHGTAITLTATVASGGKPVVHGTVNFCKATATYCEDIAILRSAQLTANGSASVSLALPAGTNSIKAVFTGAGLVTGSSSAAQTVNVTGTYPLVTTVSDTGSPGNYTIQASLTGGSWQSLGSSVINLVDATNQDFVVGSAQANPQTFGFVRKGTQATNAFPLSVVVGDFNGDGKMDFASAGDIPGNLSVMLGNGDGTFTSKPSTVNMGDAWAMASGDFNGDGKLDLAAVDYVNSTLTIALGNGDGTFTVKAVLSGYQEPQSIAVGDFNGDGIEDIAVGNARNATLSILLGKGDGTFTNGSTLYLANLGFAESLAAADIDGDGKLDLAFASSTTVVGIAYGNGDGTFTAASIGNMTGYGTAVAVGDFNSDGKPDVIVSGQTQMTVLLNQGNRQFASGAVTLPSSSDAYSVAVADFNGDGIADVAAADFDYGTLTVCYGEGGGFFNCTVQNPPAGTASLGWIGVADFDQDGGPDLVVTEPDLNSAEVYLNRGIETATFNNVDVPGSSAHQLEVLVPAQGVYTASTSNLLNVSGTPVAPAVLVQTSPGPIVAVGQTVNITVRVVGLDNYLPTSTASLFEGSTLLKTSALTNGEFTVAFTPAAAGTYSFTASYNGDANLAATNSLATPLYAAAASKTTLAVSATQAAIGTPVTLTATTVNSTGAAVTKGVINFCDATATLCENTALLGTAQLTASGTASTQLVLGIGTHSIKAVFQATQSLGSSTSTTDTVTITGLETSTTTLTSSGSGGHYTLSATVTGNGAQPLSGEVSFLDGTSGASLGQAALGATTTALSFNSSLVSVPGRSFIAVRTADFNNDGKQDAVLIDLQDGTLTVLLGNGNGTFTVLKSVSIPGATETVEVADFNGDGKPDLVIGGFYQNTQIYLGNGDGTFTLKSSLGNAQGAFRIGIGDFNHDGIPDMLLAEPFNDQLQVLIGDGTGNFSVSTVSTGQKMEPLYVAVADFNGDGNVDAAIWGYNTFNAGVPELLLLSGDGAGGFTLTNTTPTPTVQPQGIVSADFNKDGKADLALLTYGGSGPATVAILLGNGNGSFTSGATYATGDSSSQIVTSDINMDGNIDLVVANPGSETVTFLLGTGSGTFTSGSTFLTASVQADSLAVADFNNDGKPDVISPSGSGTNAEVWLNCISTTASATLSNVVVTGSTNQNMDAKFGGNTDYSASTSNTITLAP